MKKSNMRGALAQHEINSWAVGWLVFQILAQASYFGVVFTWWLGILYFGVALAMSAGENSRVIVCLVVSGIWAFVAGYICIVILQIGALIGIAAAVVTFFIAVSVNFAGTQYIVDASDYSEE